MLERNPPQPSLRDSGQCVRKPNAEALGYCRVSLRDRGSPFRAAAVPCYLPTSGAEAFPAEPTGDEALRLESERRILTSGPEERTNLAVAVGGHPVHHEPGFPHHPAARSEERR